MISVSPTVHPSFFQDSSRTLGGGSTESSNGKRMPIRRARGCARERTTQGAAAVAAALRIVRRFIRLGNPASLDHLVGAQEMRFRDRQSERARGPCIDDVRDARGLLDRNIRGLTT